MDVFICSLGAYGGPEAHLGVFTDQLVTRRKYLDETDLIELIALCSILPGPTSTQTIVAVGYRMGGPVLALLTMLVWALPVLTVMTVLSFLYQFLAGQGISVEILRYIGPMAVGFIILAAFRIGRKVVTDTPTALLMIFAAATTYFIRAPWIFPLVLVIGGAVAILLEKKGDIWNHVQIKIRRRTGRTKRLRNLPGHRSHARRNLHLPARHPADLFRLSRLGKPEADPRRAHLTARDQCGGRRTDCYRRTHPDASQRHKT